MFGTSGIRGPVGEDVTVDLAVDIGRGVASSGASSVVVGRDPRVHGSALLDALAAGLHECGADVIDVGLAATPTVARGVGWLDADVGITVTASHNPPQDNGFKFWNPSGRTFDAEQQSELADRINNANFESVSWDEYGERTTETSLQTRHRDHLLSETELERPLSVVVDIGHGAGQLTAAALEELGCAVTSLFEDPDGRFPGRPSEPTAENCTTLQETVRDTGADLGVAHDGDADRMMAVDETGRFIPGDILLALFGKQAGNDGSNATVSAPLNTSLAVDDALDSVGATLSRTRVGDTHVAARTAEPGIVFGGEPSGAWIWPDGVLCPDGPLAACRLVELVSHNGPLSSLVDEIETYPLERKNIETDRKSRVMDAVESAVQEAYTSVQTLDGVRVETDVGWFLIRASGTQSLIRITAEGTSQEDTADLANEARSLVHSAMK